jgi:hypothetical protein
MSNKNLTIDESGDPKYYIMVPQIVLALCDTPYEYALWSAIKCIAGESGECFLATDDLAAMAMMSTGKCSQSRKSLIDKGLLIGSIRKDPGYPQPVWHLTIPNLWSANREWREENPSLLDRIELKKEQKKSLHHVKPSPREEGPSPREEGPSPDETKKNQKEEPKEEPRPSPKKYTNQQLLFGQLAKICKISIDLMTKDQEAALDQAAHRLDQSGITPNEVAQFGVWWYTIFRAWQETPAAPTPAKVLETWGQFKSPPQAHKATGYQHTPEQIERIKQLSAEN